MQLVLVGAAVVSVVALQEWHTAIVVFAVTLLNAILGEMVVTATGMETEVGRVSPGC